MCGGQKHIAQAPVFFGVLRRLYRLLLTVITRRYRKCWHSKGFVTKIKRLDDLDGGIYNEKSKWFILLSLTMILGLTACGNSASKTKQPSTEDTFVESKADTESAETSTNMENTDNQDAQEHKILVAYFSATGTTKGVAEHIANGLNADIIEIVPEEAYTDADLDYNDNNSRTTIEMNDPDARPAISGSVENMEQYDIIFVGYPIWWGRGTENRQHFHGKL